MITLDSARWKFPGPVRYQWQGRWNQWLLRHDPVRQRAIRDAELRVEEQTRKLMAAIKAGQPTGELIRQQSLNFGRLLDL